MQTVILLIAAVVSAVSCAFAAAEPASLHNPPGIALVLELDKQQAYERESIPVTVTLRIQGVSVRNIGYPQLTGNGLSSSGFLPPEQSSETEDSAEITRYRFKGSIRADRPGSFTVGPATVTCDILDTAGGSAAFFGAREPRPATIDSPSAHLTIMPLPATGRPASFSGAVGSFTMHSVAHPASAAVGDPLTVTTVIRGTGSLAAASCPALSGPGLRSHPVKASRTDAMLRCEQVIIPVHPGPLPALEWSYFTPQNGVYRRIHATLPVTVSAAPFRTASTSRPPARTTPVIRHRVTSLLFNYTSLAGLLLCVGISTYCIARTAGTRNRINKRSNTVSVDYHMLLAKTDQAYASSDVEKFYTFIMQILQEALGAETGLPPRGITAVPSTYRCSKVIDTGELSHLLQRCHQVRYGRYLPRQELLKDDLHFIKAFVAHHLPA